MMNDAQEAAATPANNLNHNNNALQIQAPTLNKKAFSLKIPPLAQGSGNNRLSARIHNKNKPKMLNMNLVTAQYRSNSLCAGYPPQLSGSNNNEKGPPMAESKGHQDLQQPVHYLGLLKDQCNNSQPSSKPGLPLPPLSSKSNGHRAGQKPPMNFLNIPNQLDTILKRPVNLNVNVGSTRCLDNKIQTSQMLKELETCSDKQINMNALNLPTPHQRQIQNLP